MVELRTAPHLSRQSRFGLIAASRARRAAQTVAALVSGQPQEAQHLFPTGHPMDIHENLAPFTGQAEFPSVSPKGRQQDQTVLSVTLRVTTLVKSMEIFQSYTEVIEIRI